MAQKTIVELSDDIDGTRAAETVTFGLDGAAYEIDLSAENAAALRGSLSVYVEHARKAGARGAKSVRKYGQAAPGYDPKAVRVWAAANGVGVPARGRIPAAVLSQFRDAGN